MIIVLGAGSWGSALASVLAANKHEISICGREQEVLDDIVTNHRNSNYLGNLPLFSEIYISNYTVNTATEFDQLIRPGVKYILIAIPSSGFTGIIAQLKDILITKKLGKIPLICATKGLCESEDGKPLWLHEVIEQNLGKDYPYSILSGPSFAKEVAEHQPTSIVLAAKNLAAAKVVSQLFHNNNFRVYLGDDVMGVQLGGAVKNILAFAVGCAEGYGFGCNARAAIITRGLHEMLVIGNILGAKRETLMGLSGLGDLVLTATDNQSRNKRFGNYIGQGMTVEQALAKVGQHVASYNTTRLIYLIVKQYKIDAPLSEQAYQILFNGLEVEQAINNLAMRPQKPE